MPEPESETGVGVGAIGGAQRGGGSPSGGKEVMEFLPQVFLPLKQSKTQMQ